MRSHPVHGVQHLYTSTTCPLRRGDTAHLLWAGHAVRSDDFESRGRQDMVRVRPYVSWRGYVHSCAVVGGQRRPRQPSRTRRPCTLSAPLHLLQSERKSPCAGDVVALVLPVRLFGNRQDTSLSAHGLPPRLRAMLDKDRGHGKSLSSLELLHRKLRGR